MTTIIKHTENIIDGGLKHFELIKQDASKYKTIGFAIPKKHILKYLKNFSNNGYYLLKNNIGYYVIGDNNIIVAYVSQVTKGFYIFKMLKEIYEGK
tara:strand:- start:553 stop:840 length:288 start_codon:yes stop_codon:yes gene_type:complete